MVPWVFQAQLALHPAQNTMRWFAAGKQHCLSMFHRLSMCPLLLVALQAVAQLGGWQVVSRQLGLTPQRQARRPVPATPQQLAEALTQWMAANPPPAMPPRTMAALESDPMCSATQLPRTSRTQGVGAGAVGPSTSRSSRDRLAGGSDVQHRGWQQLPTQKQLLAAGRRDLVAGLQKHGARSVGALLGLPVSPQGPTTKVGGHIGWVPCGAVSCHA